MQRLLTRGVYDHVGMVLRNRRGRIYVLECMGDTPAAAGHACNALLLCSHRWCCSSTPPSVAYSYAAAAAVILAALAAAASAASIPAATAAAAAAAAARFRCSSPFRFQSADGRGVILTPWSSFVNNNWYRVYERVSWRRLYWPVSDERLSRLLEFLKKVIGKDYKLTLAKLLSRKPYDSSAADGFFCSELVAGAWRVMGVIPEDAICSQYWPETFSQRLEDKQLRLTPGCSLGDELLIDFCLYTPQQQQQQKKKKKKRVCLHKHKSKPKQSPADLPQILSVIVGRATTFQEKEGKRDKRETQKETNTRSNSPVVSPSLQTPETASPTAAGSPRLEAADAHHPSSSSNNKENTAEAIEDKQTEPDTLEAVKQRLKAVSRRLSWQHQQQQQEQPRQEQREEREQQQQEQQQQQRQEQEHAQQQQEKMQVERQEEQQLQPQEDEEQQQQQQDGDRHTAEDKGPDVAPS
ncbi:hypothetical protein Emed_003766 [Eimeria media]